MAQQQTQKENNTERKGQGAGGNPKQFEAGQGQQSEGHQTKAKQQGAQNMGTRSSRQAQGGTDLDEEREESMESAEGERDVQDSARQ